MVGNYETRLINDIGACLVDLGYTGIRYMYLSQYIFLSSISIDLLHRNPQTPVWQGTDVCELSAESAQGSHKMFIGFL